MIQNVTSSPPALGAFSTNLTSLFTAVKQSNETMQTTQATLAPGLGTTKNLRKILTSAGYSKKEQHQLKTTTPTPEPTRTEAPDVIIFKKLKNCVRTVVIGQIPCAKHYASTFHVLQDGKEWASRIQQGGRQLLPFMHKKGEVSFEAGTLTSWHGDFNKYSVNNPNSTYLVIEPDYLGGLSESAEAKTAQEFKDQMLRVTDIITYSQCHSSYVWPYTENTWCYNMAKLRSEIKINCGQYDCWEIWDAMEKRVSTRTMGGCDWRDYKNTLSDPFFPNPW